MSDWKYPAEKVLFHLKDKNGLFTLVQYNRDVIVYTTSKMEGVARTSSNNYKCLHGSYFKSSSESAKDFDNCMRNCFRSNNEGRVSSLINQLNDMSEEQRKAYFSDNGEIL